MRSTWVVFVTNETSEHFNASALVKCQHISVCLFYDLIVGLWDEWLVFWGWAKLNLCSDMLGSLRISQKLSRQLVPRKETNVKKGAEPSHLGLSQNLMVKSITFELVVLGQEADARKVIFGTI